MEGNLVEKSNNGFEQTGADESGETPPPLRLVSKSQWQQAGGKLTAVQARWALAQGFTAERGQVLCLPDADGGLDSVWLGAGAARPNLVSYHRAIDESDAQEAAGATTSGGGEENAGKTQRLEPATDNKTSHESRVLLPALFGASAPRIPPGCYRLADASADESVLAAVALSRAQYVYRAPRVGDDFSPLWRGGSPTERKVWLQLAKREMNYMAAVAQADDLVRNLVNTPANLLGTIELEQAAKQVAKRLGMAVSVIEGSRLERDFPLIAAVGAASSRPPRLVELTSADEHEAAASADVCIVGKGIVFDTGGLDLKPSRAMLLMKKDMGGAAHALGLTSLVRMLLPSCKVRTIIPIAENSVSGGAFRPGDVLTARDGTRVEVGNTDAEGRLVLADALSYAGASTPSTLITLATLTGAARVALGTDLPAMFCDNDKWAEEIAHAGAYRCDAVWRMPMYAGYDADLRSHIADIHSTGTKGGMAGATLAAMFLRRFVARPRSWVHLDLYAWGKTPGIAHEGARMQGVETLFSWLRDRQRHAVKPI